MIPVNSVKVVLSTTMKLTIVHLTKIYAGINYSEMDQIMPIILDKENIPPHALEDHSHVAIGNATTDSCSEMDQNTPNTLDKKISHQMLMNIKAMLELAPRPQQAVHYLCPMVITLSLYCVKIPKFISSLL